MTSTRGSTRVFCLSTTWRVRSMSSETLMRRANYPPLTGLGASLRRRATSDDLDLDDVRRIGGQVRFDAGCIEEAEAPLLGRGVVGRRPFDPKRRTGRLAEADVRRGEAEPRVLEGDLEEAGRDPYDAGNALAIRCRDTGAVREYPD